jgi:hypothetical protein
MFDEIENPLGQGIGMSPVLGRQICKEPQPLVLRPRINLLVENRNITGQPDEKNVAIQQP